MINDVRKILNLCFINRITGESKSIDKIQRAHDF